MTSIIDTRNTAITADGIPLESFSPLAANNIVLMFALLGFGARVLVHLVNPNAAQPAGVCEVLNRLEVPIHY